MGLRSRTFSPRELRYRFAWTRRLPNLGLPVNCFVCKPHPLLINILGDPREIVGEGETLKRDGKNKTPLGTVLKCEQSLFSSKIRGEDHLSPDARATSGSQHRRSHVTFTVTLARLLVLRSRVHHGFSKKRDCSQSICLQIHRQ